MSLNSIQVKTSATAPASFAYFHPATTEYAILRNTSAVSIDYTTDAGSTVSVLAAGAHKLLAIDGNTADVGIRRTDQNAASVNVVIGYGFNADDIDVIVSQPTPAATSAAAAAVADHNADTTAHGLSTFNVEDFGAINGGGNSTAAFQGAITAAKAAGGGIILIPAGLWFVDEVVIDAPYLRVVGRGMGATIVKSITGLNVFVLSGSVHDCDFEDMTVEGTLSGSGCGIKVGVGSTYAWKIQIRRCEFKNHGGHGIDLSSNAGDTFNIRVDDCVASGNMLDGFRIENSLCTILTGCYVIDVAAGRAGYRLLSGGILIGCNGINNGSGVWGRFGADGGVESGGLTLYPKVQMYGCNVEDFESIGVEFISPAAIALFSGCIFLSKESLANQKAIRFAQGTVDDVVVETLHCVFTLGDGSSWSNATPIEVASGYFVLSSNRASPADYWSVGSSMLVKANCEYVPSGPSSSNYGYSTRRLGGCTDLENVVGFSVGNPIADGATRFIGRTAMPTTGAFPRDVFVIKTGPTVVQGGAGSRYTVLGWRRLTATSNHELGVDWVEVRCPTGT